MSHSSSGLKAWLVQRVSAVYMALFSFYLLYHFIFRPPANFYAWYDWVSNPLVSVSLAVFLFAMIFHAGIGLRDIIIDYVHPFYIRIVLLIGVAVVFTISAMWVLRVVFLLQFT